MGLTEAQKIKLRRAVTRRAKERLRKKKEAEAKRKAKGTAEPNRLKRIFQTNT